MQRIKTVTPHAIFMELCPFVIINIDIVPIFITLKPFKVFLQNMYNVDHDQTVCREQELTPYRIFTKLCPIVIMSIEIVYA